MELDGRWGSGESLPRLAEGVWVLDFLQERFHTTSAGGFERVFIKAGDKETKDRLILEEAIGESRGGLLWLPRNTGKK